jgi:hypothetical protein
MGTLSRRGRHRPPTCTRPLARSLSFVHAPTPPRRLRRLGRRTPRLRHVPAPSGRGCSSCRRGLPPPAASPPPAPDQRLLGGEPGAPVADAETVIPSFELDEVPVPEVRAQAIARVDALGLPLVQRTHHRWGEQRGVRERGEADEGHGVGESLADASRDLHGEAGLPDAAYPGEREQPHVRPREQSLSSSSSRSRPTSGVAGWGKADTAADAGAASADEAAPLRSGTAARSAARPSSGNSRASARGLTVWGCGRLLTPRSRALTALEERPARKASSSCVRPAGSLRLRRRAPNDVAPLSGASFLVFRFPTTSRIQRRILRAYYLPRPRSHPWLLHPHTLSLCGGCVGSVRGRPPSRAAQ